MLRLRENRGEWYSEKIGASTDAEEIGAYVLAHTGS